MANSTVFSFKADLKDVNAALKATESAAKEAFGGWAAAVDEANIAERTLLKVTSEQNAAVNALRSQLTALEEVKKREGKLTAEQTLEYKRLKQELASQKKIRTELIAKEREHVAQANRLTAAQARYGKSIDAYSSKLKQTTKTKDKATSSSERHANALRKEDAERRALGTTLVRHIRRLESLAVAYYAVTRAYQSTFGAGVQLNRQYENMELGLTALLSAKTKAVDQYGREADAVTKFNVAQQATAATLDQIKKASLDTPATFAEMTGFYQQAIGHALAAGEAFGSSVDEISQNTITLTKRMSSLGASMGMSMDLMNEEIRSIMSGDVSRDSKLALVLFGSPTAANAAIKEAKKQVGGLTNLMNEVLSPFSQLEGIMTYDKQMNHLLFQIQEIQRAASEPIFKDLEEGARQLTELLKENHDEIVAWIKAFYEGAKQITPVVLDLAKAFVAVKAFNFARGIAAGTTAFVEGHGVYDITTKKMVKLKSVQLALNAAIRANPYLIVGTAMIAAYEFFEAQSEKTQEQFRKENELHQAMLRNVHFKNEALTEEEKIQKAINAQVENLVRLQTQGGSNQAIKSTEASLTALGEALQKVSGKETALTDKGILQFVKDLDDRLAAGKITMAEYIKELEWLQNKTTEGATYTLTTKPTDTLPEGVGDAPKGKEFGPSREGYDDWVKQQFAASERALELWRGYFKNVGDMEMAWLLSPERSQAYDEALVAGLTGDAIDEYVAKQEELFKSSIDGYEKMLKAIDDLSASSHDWTAGLTGNAKAIANIGNAFADIDKQGQKYQTVLTGIDKLKISDEKKAELRSKATKANQQAEIAGYANLAGAISGAFAEGSDAAKAFQGVQGALALYNAVTAVTGAWASAPFPANLPAVASTTAAVIALLSQIGQTFGGGGGGSSGPSKAQVAFKEAEADVKEITDRLDKQIELLEVISLSGSATYGEMEATRIAAEQLVPAAKDVIAGNVRYNVIEDMHTSRTYFQDAARYFYENFADEYALTAPEAVESMDPEKFKADLKKFFETATVEDMQALVSETGSALFYKLDSEVKPALENLTGYISDFAKATLSTYRELKDSVGDWRDIYDEITGTNYFKDLDIAAATAKVDEMMQKVGASTYEEFYKMLGSIDVNISELEKAIIGTAGEINYDELYRQTKAVNDALQAAGINASLTAEDLLNMTDALDLVGESLVESAQGMSNAAQALRDAWLGEYSPLTLLQKTAYANNIAYLAASTGQDTATDAAYAALQTAAASATRDEDIAGEFRRYTRLLEAQVADSTNTDIVNAIVRNGETLNDLIDRIERNTVILESIDAGVSA